MFNLKVLGLIILQFSVAFCINEEVIIHKNDMSIQMQQYVIDRAIQTFESQTDLNIAAKIISYEMNIKFGKNWNCFAGINSSFAGISVESKENSFIWFSINENHFVVVKQDIDIKIIDPIIDARTSDPKVVVIRDEMSDSMKNNVLIMVKNAINSFDDTESISKHMVQTLEERYDYSWICLIGSTGNDEKLLKNAENSSILSLRIESLLITIFKIKHELQKNVN
jgi:hypothetical protein